MSAESSSCTSSVASLDAANTAAVTLVAKWGKERITLENLPRSTKISEVKEILTEKTGILPKRQKLIGLSVSGSRGAPDTASLSDLREKAPKKARDGSPSDAGAAASAAAAAVVVHQFILMGTAEENIFVDPREKDVLPDVVDDFDLDFNAGSEEWIQHVANGENLKKFTERTEIHIMNEPRDGKPLMVLDLDHTLLDFSSKAIQRDTATHRVGDGAAALMKRPFMDKFLVAVYKEYDLVVWSQTSWRWLETKLTELGMLTHPGYRFCFVLDKTSMFSVKSTKRDGSSYEHQVKPLQIIWSKFPLWGPHNTLHLDDLSRNFALNLQSGLKVTPYYRKKSKGKRDAELMGLARYCETLAKSGLRFEEVDFSLWEHVVSGNRSIEETAKVGEQKK